MSKALTLDMIQAKCRTDHIDFIKNLNLWGNDLEDVSLVSSLPNLEVLSLSVNRIKSLSPFRGLKKLKELYLRKNNISNLNELYNLADLRELKSLSLSENPVAKSPHYRQTISELLPHLIKLDDKLIEKDEQSPIPFEEPKTLAFRQSRQMSNPAQIEELFYHSNRNSSDMCGRITDLGYRDKIDENSLENRRATELKPQIHYQSYDSRQEHKFDRHLNKRIQKPIIIEQDPTQSNKISILSDKRVEDIDLENRQSSLSPSRKRMINANLELDLGRKTVPAKTHEKESSDNKMTKSQERRKTELNTITFSIKKLITILTPFELEVLKSECEKRLSQNYNI